MTNTKGSKKSFHLEFITTGQKIAWMGFEQHDVLFMLGPAGTGKSHISVAFAISELLAKRRKKIILTRPVIEAGESLGYLPGTFEEKVNPYIMPLYDAIEECVGSEGIERERVNRALEIAPIAFLRGRATTLDTDLITPSGLIKMQEIKVNDCVIGSDGDKKLVIGVYPQGKKPIYKVTFSDRTFVKCSDDHLWLTMNLSEKRHCKGYSVKTTKMIRETLKAANGQKNHKIPLISEPVHFDSKAVAIDPYLFGILLGDGHIGRTAVKFTNSNEEIIREVENRLPDSMKISKVKSSKKYDYNLVSSGKITWRNNLINEFKNLELAGLTSENKFIPDVYKFNSVDVRIEVLRGLMDADGWICINKSGTRRVQFCSTSERLAQDVAFLVRSLGGIAYVRKREYKDYDYHYLKNHKIIHKLPSYVLDISIEMNPFRMKRKAQIFEIAKSPNLTKLIASIEYCGEEECQCIEVDANDRLFLVNDCIITHNTFKNAICILDEAQNATYMQLKLFLTRLGDNSKLIINGDPSQSDLRGELALMKIVKQLESEKGVGIVEFKENSIVRHPLVAKILKRLD